MILKLFDWRVVGILFLLVWNSANGQNTPILWDTSHGVQWNYSPEKGGLYYAVRQFLGEHGFVIKTDFNKELTENLSANQFEVLVLTVAVEESYKKAEAEKIKRFVQEGGKLLVLCDTAYSVSESGINHITNRFGITCGGDNISADAVQKLKHSAFSKVFRVRLESAGSLTVNSPAQTIGYSSQQAVIAIAEINKGKVMVVGDLDVFKNDYIFEYTTNKPFALAAFRWLLMPNNRVKTTDVEDDNHSTFTDIGIIRDWAKSNRDEASQTETSESRNDDKAVRERVRQVLEQARLTLKKDNGQCRKEILQEYKKQLRQLDKEMKALIRIKEKISPRYSKLKEEIKPLKQKMDEFTAYRNQKNDNSNQQQNWENYDNIVLLWRKKQIELKPLAKQVSTVMALSERVSQMLKKMQQNVNFCQ